MNELIEKVKEYDPLGMNQDPHLIKYRSKYNLVAFFSLAAFTIVTILYILLALVSDRNSKVSHYEKQYYIWKSHSESEVISSIRMGMKIMPSENTRQNLIELNWANDSSLLYNHQKHAKYVARESFHFFYDTPYYFPTLRINEESVPYGNSDSYCFYLSWVDKEREGIYDLYESVKKLPNCSNAYDNGFVWRKNDPMQGVDIKAFIQKTEIMKSSSLSSSASTCKSRKGIAKKLLNSSIVCYTYEILNDVCFKIMRVKGGWEYLGGCFKGNTPAHYIEADVNTLYDLKNVLIQVRDIMDPYLNSTSNTAIPDFGVNIDWIYCLLGLVFWLSLISIIGCSLFYVFRKQIAMFMESRSKSDSTQN